MDLISVIMPFYKKREYFKQSLLSVINQTYQNIEIIIIFDDNYNSDIEFIQKFLDLDKRIKLIDNKKIWVWQYLEIRVLKYLKEIMLPF